MLTPLLALLHENLLLTLALVVPLNHVMLLSKQMAFSLALALLALVFLQAASQELLLLMDQKLFRWAGSESLYLAGVAVQLQAKYGALSL
jgi:hypothetical protein